MRALVTGAAGFVGRHVAGELHYRGYGVVGVDVQPMPLGSRQTDMLDWLATDDTVYDLVVHAAAVAPHRAAIDGRPMHLVTNLELDAALFGWAVRTRQRRILYISSSAAYPVRLQTEEFHRYCGARIRRLEERDINLTQWGKTGDWSPDAGYGWLKLTGERMAAEANAAGVPTYVVRPFSGYGEDQGPDWPFGAFAARARRREDPFTIWGDGTQVRDWLHVSDLVNGALAVVDQDVRQPVNLCTGVGTSMAELVQMFCQQAGYSPEIELRVDRPAGVPYRVGDPSRMLRVYEPQVTLEQGVKRALEVG